MNKQIELSEDEFKKIGNVINDELQKGEPGDPPKFIALTGPIASGKTTIRRTKYSSGYVLIDSGELFDIFKKNELEDSQEKTEAYLMVAGIDLVKRSIDEKKNIIIFRDFSIFIFINFSQTNHHHYRPTSG